MNNHSLDQLIDLSCLKQLLASHHRLSGMSYSLFDARYTLLAAIGWQDICVRFHQANPISHARCLASKVFIAEHVYGHENDYVEYRCRNGMIDVAIPIVIEGQLLAIFSTGQFFYEDEQPDMAYFRAQAEELGFAWDAYLKALQRVPVFSRDYARGNMIFLRNVVDMLVKKGWNNLRLMREMEDRKRVEAALVVSERQFRTLTENSPDGIARFDRECRRLYVNPALKNLFNQPVDEVLGKKPSDFSPLPDALFFEQMVREAWETGQVLQREFLFRATHGEARTALVTAVPECNAEGTIESVLTVGRDISALKKAENTLRASEQHLRTLAETLPGVTFTLQLHPDGTLCMPYVSPRIVELNGLFPGDMATDLGKFIAGIHPDDRDRARESIAEAVRIRAPWQDAFRWQHPVKGNVWVEARSTPARQPDGSTLWFGFFHDITEQKKMERALFAARKMEIIGQLAGGVAHEVRNPLNAILSISEALFKENAIANNPKFVPYIDHIRTQVHRLSKLMTDLLDLGKPIRAATIRPVALDRLCTDTIALWQVTETARDHPVTLLCDRASAEAFRVRADGMRLQQALLNLMDNAAQCSPKGSGIVLRIVEAGERTLAVQVQDAGTGVAQEKIERVFEPFFSLRSGGTGLGLALVKHFIENMGGEIRIHNNVPPPGCTAELLLTLAEQSDVEDQTEDTAG